LAFNSIYYNKFTLVFTIWWIIWNTIAIFAFYEFGIHLKTDKDRCIPSLIMFWAMLIGFIGGISTTLPTFGIMIYPKYQISICLYAVLIAYGIFYHRLLPINIVIKRSIIYSLLVATITLTYLLSVLISQQLFHQYFGYSSTIIGSIIIAIAFIPFKNSIQNFVDRFFLKATPLEIAQENEQLRQEITQAERMKSIAVLASGMAHEIKNPLTPIKTFSEQLPSRINDKEFLLKFSRIINKEVDRIDSLVQDLLNFAKPSPPELTRVNIHQLIAQTLDLLNNETIRHKIHLNTSFENKNTLIYIDPKQIKQALLNIFLNAIEAMPNGGTLSISTSVIASTLSERSESKGTKQSFIIEIADTGCGISPKDLPHIFDPFFSKKDHGTGLGLSITHEIIRKHNGKILAKSELGRSTTFKIELPV
jgi:signal transduction histidine kinase